MKKAIRLLSLVLTVIMVSGCLSVFVSAASPRYADVKNTDDYAFEIGALNVIGLMQGKTQTDFGYGDQITRRQMAILMARVMSGKVDKKYEEENFKGDKNTTPFKDLDAKGDYYGAIEIVNKLGIVNGTSPTSFDPNSGIMYRDALTMLVRALGYDTSSMKEGYPWSYVTYADGLGLTKGMTRSIGINEKLTRAEVAKLIFNAFLYARCKDGSYLRTAFGYEEPTVVTIAKNQYAVPEGRTAWQGVKLQKRGWNGTANQKNIEFDFPVTDVIQSGGISVGSQMDESMALAFTFASDTVEGGSFGDFYLMLKKVTPLQGNQTKTECINLGKIEPETYTNENNEYTFSRYGTREYRLTLGETVHVISGNYSSGSSRGMLTLGNVLSAYNYVSGTSKSNDYDGYYRLLTEKSIESSDGRKELDQWVTTNNKSLYSSVTAYDFDFDGAAEIVVFNKSNIGRVQPYIKTDGINSSIICSRFTVGTASYDSPGMSVEDKARAAEVEPADIVNLTGSPIRDNAIVVWQYDNLTGKVTVSRVLG